MENINEMLDVMLLSHFHLDHCGAIPFLTEKAKYKGPIVTLINK
jgi:integrator complex subunit 11